MIKTHIATEQYCFVEMEYEDLGDFEKSYPKHYLAVKRAQNNAERLVREAKEKASPKV